MQGLRSPTSGSMLEEESAPSESFCEKTSGNPAFACTARPLRDAWVSYSMAENRFRGIFPLEIVQVTLPSDAPCLTGRDGSVSVELWPLSVILLWSS